jgi:deoxyribodipyrimidine photolyase
MGGQLYFSSKLVDCCYANNTGNWHWVASDEVDASGQRFGKGWSGRRINPEKLKEGDVEYLKRWAAPVVQKIVDWRARWKEWLSLTAN